MNQNLTFEEMQDEFRRLSVGKASLAHRIQYLRAMITCAKKEGVDKDELEKMRSDLDDYEFQLFRDFCDDFIVRKRKGVPYFELHEKFQIVNKFSARVQNNAEYEQVFRTIRKQYRLRSKIIRTLYIVAFVLLACATAATAFFGWTEWELREIARNIRTLSDSNSVASLATMDQAQNRLATLSDNFYNFPIHEQKIQTLLDDLSKIKEQKRKAQFLQITHSIGDTARYVTEVEKYLQMFPNPEDASTVERNVSPYLKQYEILLTYHRFVSTALCDPSKLRTQKWDTPDFYPVFIPEWRQLSQYNTFEEQLQLGKEQELFGTMIEFYQKKATAPDEWEYHREGWSPCYYTTSEPLPDTKKPGQFLMSVPCSDGKTREISVEEEPLRAPYITVANTCWRRILKQQEKMSSTSSFQLEIFWLKMLNDIAMDVTLDPLYRCYYLAHTMQHLKLKFPTLYQCHFAAYETVSVDEEDSLLNRVLEAELHKSPEKMESGRTVALKIDDNSRRETAIALLSPIQTLIASAYESAKTPTCQTYTWHGWISPARTLEVNPDANKRKGLLYVILPDTQNRAVRWIQIGKCESGRVTLDAKITPEMRFQPVWLKCPVVAPTP